MQHAAQQRGFSLVEMLVAVSLFAVVMLVSVGALLALVDANRKAQALQSVMNNLNVTLDGMVRAVRMGTDYHCGNIGVQSETRDCLTGESLLAFESFSGDPDDGNDQWVYWFDEDTNRLYKSEDGGANSYAITAPEVEINDLQFYVVGSTRGDERQPRVVIVVRGTAGGEDIRTSTTFNIQATASQRLLDI